VAAIEDFMETLPARKVPGIGKVTEKILRGLGIETCGDIRRQAIMVWLNFTENAFEFMLKCSYGVYKAFHDDHSQKSIGVS